MSTAALSVSASTNCGLTAGSPQSSSTTALRDLAIYLEKAATAEKAKWVQATEALELSTVKE
jgi:hypothetical protein